MPGSALSEGPVQEEQKSRPVLESRGFIPYGTLLKIFPKKHVSLDWLAGNGRKDRPAPENDALQPLWDIAKDFSPEECAQLIKYTRLLALKHKQFNKEP